MNNFIDRTKPWAFLNTLLNWSQACKEEWSIYTDANPRLDSMKILANICKGDSEEEKMKIARDNINALEVLIFDNVRLSFSCFLSS